jgi:hypothetical protein
MLPYLIKFGKLYFHISKYIEADRLFCFFVHRALPTAFYQHARRDERREALRARFAAFKRTSRRNRPVYLNSLNDPSSKALAVMLYAASRRAR